MGPPGLSGHTTSTFTISTSGSELIALGTFILLELILPDFAEKGLLVGLEGLVVFILIERREYDVEHVAETDPEVGGVGRLGAAGQLN